jgi:hypothetical protein
VHQTRTHRGPRQPTLDALALVVGQKVTEEATVEQIREREEKPLVELKCQGELADQLVRAVQKLCGQTERWWCSA